MKKKSLFLNLFLCVLTAFFISCGEDEKDTNSTTAKWYALTDIKGSFPQDGATIESKFIADNGLMWNTLQDPDGDLDVYDEYSMVDKPEAGELMYYDVYMQEASDFTKKPAKSELKLQLIINNITNPESAPVTEVTWAQITTGLGLNTLPNNTQYYWQVVAYDIMGQETIGPVWSFTTAANNLPDAPILGTPAEGAVSQKQTFQFTWTAPADFDGDKLRCNLFLSSTSCDATGTPLVSDLTPTGFAAGNYSFSHTITTPLDADTVYYWRVEVYDCVNGEWNTVTVQSACGSFSTGDSYPGNTFYISTDFLKYSATGTIETVLNTVLGTDAAEPYKDHFKVLAGAPVIDIAIGRSYPSLRMPNTATVGISAVNHFNAATLQFDVKLRNTADEVTVKINNSSQATVELAHFKLAADKGTYHAATEAVVQNTVDLTRGPNTGDFASMTGTVDLTGGSVTNWSTTAQRFNIIVNGVTFENIELNDLSLTLNEVVAEVNQALTTAGANTYVTAVAVTPNIQLRSVRRGSGAVIVINDPTAGVSALTDLGYANGQIATGDDWGVISNQQNFTIRYGSGTAKTITLDANCATRAAVIALINLRLADTSTGGEDLSPVLEAIVDPDSTEYIRIKTKSIAPRQAQSFTIGAGSALTVLGLTAGTTSGDGFDSNLIKVFTKNYNASDDDYNSYYTAFPNANYDWVENTPTTVIGYDTWFRVAVSVNLATYQYTVSINGTSVASGVTTGEAMTGIDLYSNYFYSTTTADQFNLSCTGGTVWVDNMSFQITDTAWLR